MIKKKIDLSTYSRRGLYEVFKDRDIPFFSTTCNVDITELHQFAKSRNKKLFIVLSFIISKTVNLIPQFRHRIINDELYEFERVDPGFTFFLDDETFSFCDSKYFEDFKFYYDYALEKIEETKNKPDRTIGEKNHMFFITSIPWFSFTSFTHPYNDLYGTIPIITIGKFFRENSKILIPLAVQVHHGVIDGFHVGKLYEQVGEMCRFPERHLKGIHESTKKSANTNRVVGSL